MFLQIAILFLQKLSQLAFVCPYVKVIEQSIYSQSWHVLRLTQEEMEILGYYKRNLKQADDGVNSYQQRVHIKSFLVLIC